MKKIVMMAVPLLSLCVQALPTGFIVADGARTVAVGAGGKKTPIVLRGVNAGSWLVTEDWMYPGSLTSDFKSEHGQYEMEEALVAKFGREKTAALYSAFRDAWWQESDFDNVKALGLNCIRLPFGWKDFIGPDGKPRTEGFRRVDWFVKNCKKRGLYVILDLHGAPGSQNGRHHSGDTRRPHLFKDPAALDLCCKLWTSVASRYKGNATVAAYDLLNEPEGHPGGLTSDPAVVAGLDRLYKTVRKADPDHLIMIESCWGPEHLPAPSSKGWKNVCYQYHLYCWNGGNNFERHRKFIESAVQNQKKVGHGVPVLVGEFSFFDCREAWDMALKTFGEQGWGWTIWSYKLCQAKSSWGIYNSAEWRNKSNVATPEDDFETIRRKWTKVDTKSVFHENKWLADVVRKYGERVKE